MNLLNILLLPITVPLSLIRLTRAYLIVRAAMLRIGEKPPTFKKWLGLLNGDD